MEILIRICSAILFFQGKNVHQKRFNDLKFEKKHFDTFKRVSIDEIGCRWHMPNYDFFFKKVHTLRSIICVFFSKMNVQLCL